MILDELKNADRWRAVHPGFAAAFSYLRSKDLTALAGGRQEIDGSKLYAVVVRAQGNGKQKAKLEAHRKYIDIQYQVSGTDIMGWKNTPTCSMVDRAYDDKDDAALFNDPPDFFLSTRPGSFAIFFPEDAHAPMACEEQVQKVVVKVAVDWK